MRTDNCLYIIVPCYNEEEVLPITSGIFLKELKHLIECGKVSGDSKIMFVNDGSTDSSWDIITGLAANDSHFVGISQSRNRGHQSSVYAGLMEAAQYADMVVSIDCDGQDDITAAEKMVDEYLDGCDIVYGVRKDRKSDTVFKRCSAGLFYRLLGRLGAETVYNHADYRLLSKRVIMELAKFNEVNLYLRGLIPLVGFKSTCVYYSRSKRIAGKSHYSLSKMLSLALDGITSLSNKPLRIVMNMGILFSVVSFIGVIWAVIDNFIGNTVAGWASTICIVCFMGGIQLICLGVIGEYVGKIYMEVKHRPRYIISDRTDSDNSQ